MINQGNMAIFIDNIIVTMDTKEGHNELVMRAQKEEKFSKYSNI